MGYDMVESRSGTSEMRVCTTLNESPFHRADFCCVDSRYDEAKTAFNKVVCIDPRHGQGLACLGMVHHVLGELDSAILRYHEVSTVPIQIMEKRRSSHLFFHAGTQRRPTRYEYH